MSAMSGIIGIIAKEPVDVASSVYYGLFALQHRGQESCGIAVNDDGVFRYDIFAAHKVRLNTTVYGMKIDSPELREEFISFAMDYSELETGSEPTIRDSLLTLSTCSGGSKNRWVVQAVKNPTECFKREN